MNILSEKNNKKKCRVSCIYTRLCIQIGKQKKPHLKGRYHLQCTKRIVTSTKEGKIYKSKRAKHIQLAN